MVNFWYIGPDFTSARSKRIGASDIPALIPNPEKPTESLAGYGRTPITVWQEKTGRKEREPAGLPAEMGHYLETKAIELFIREFSGPGTSKEYVRQRMIYELNRDGADTAEFNTTPYLHNVQYHRDGMIVHPDAVHVGAAEPEGKRINRANVSVIPKSDYLIEAKSATFWSVRRPEGSIVSGYDMNDRTWQGIPLKHYMQIQFQLAMLEVERAYLSLIYNTSEWKVWEIRAHPGHQAKLVDLAQRMVYHIERDESPRDLAMNVDDIMELYPTLGTDFVILNGEERDSALELARTYHRHKAQEKAHGAKAKEASDSIATILRDRPSIRDDEGVIAAWIEKAGSEAVMAVSKIKESYPEVYKYLQRKKCLTERKGSRYVDIKSIADA